MKEDCRLHALSARRALVLAGFDGQILEDSELCIEFSVDKNWIFRFECEKYGAPAWRTSIASREGSGWAVDGFSIPILMQAFGGLKGEEYGLPSIKNQIDFLYFERSDVFENVDFYRDEYNRLNEADF